MTPVKFLSPQDIPEMRHFLTACNPCPVKYMSLHEVGHVLPSVQLEDSVDLGTALSIQQLLQGPDEDELRRVRSVDDKGTGGAKGVVRAICQHLRKLDDYYFSCNLKLGPTDAHTPAVQLLDQIRCKFAAGEWWSAAAAARVTDIYTTSLILIGGCSTHTGSHLDWTEAKNIALATCKKDLGIVLAVWIFLHPPVAHTADVWLRNNGHKDGFSTAGKVHLASAMIDQLSLHLGKDQGGQPYCIKIEQKRS